MISTFSSSITAFINSFRFVYAVKSSWIFIFTNIYDIMLTHLLTPTKKFTAVKSIIISRNRIFIWRVAIYNKIS